MSIISENPVRSIRILESHIDKKYIYENTPGIRKFSPKWIRAVLNRIVAERSARQFDLLISLSSEDAKDWSRFVKTKIINNVVHLQRKGKHSTCDSKRVIFSGRYVEQKGVFDLLKIWKIVFIYHPDWHLDLYGDGPLGEELRSKAVQLNANIHVFSSDANIMDRYCEHSILVLSSLFEPFGLVIVEAMSCGLPVVAFNCPYGPSNIISDGKDGFLVPDRDIECFANRICQLIDNKDLRLRMGQHGIISAQNYSSEKIMPQWIQLFDDLKSSSSDSH